MAASVPGIARNRFADELMSTAVGFQSPAQLRAVADARSHVSAQIVCARQRNTCCGRVSIEPSHPPRARVVADSTLTCCPKPSFVSIAFDPFGGRVRCSADGIEMAPEARSRIVSFTSSLGESSDGSFGTFGGGGSGPSSFGTRVYPKSRMRLLN